MRFDIWWFTIEDVDGSHAFGQESDGSVEHSLDVGGGFAVGIGQDCCRVGGVGLAYGDEELIDGHGCVNCDFSTVQGC